MAKRKKIKLPKHIGGVKIPKKLRKSGVAMLEHVNQPLVREVLASGLVALAASLANSKGARRTGRKAKEGLTHVTDAGARTAGDAAEAIGAAVAAAMDRWLGGSLHWQAARQDDPEQGEPNTPESSKRARKAELAAH